MNDHDMPPGEYIIPRRIARGYQLVPGIGMKDVAFPAMGVGLGIFFWILLDIFGVPLLLRGFVAMVPVGLGAALALPLDEIHVWEWVRDFRQFGTKTKTIFYDWRRDDW